MIVSFSYVFSLARLMLIMIQLAAGVVATTHAAIATKDEAELETTTAANGFIAIAALTSNTSRPEEVVASGSDNDGGGNYADDEMDATTEREDRDLAAKARLFFASLCEFLKKIKK
jgi:hypothetical protein